MPWATGSVRDGPSLPGPLVPTFLRPQQPVGCSPSPRPFSGSVSEANPVGPSACKVPHGGQGALSRPSRACPSAVCPWQDLRALEETKLKELTPSVTSFKTHCGCLLQSRVSPSCPKPVYKYLPTPHTTWKVRATGWGSETALGLIPANPPIPRDGDWHWCAHHVTGNPWP